MSFFELSWPSWRLPGGRRRWLLLLVAGIGLFFALFSLGGAGADARAPAELAGVQWRRLTRQWARSTAPPVLPAAAVAPSWRPVPAHCAESRPWLVDRDPRALAAQAEEYGIRRAKTILQLQQFRRTYSVRIADHSGREGLATLINLNPRINSWYLLQLDWDREPPRSYHLSNARPDTVALTLSADFAGGVVLVGESGRHECDLWSSEGPASLAAASLQLAPYATLCDDAVVLRRPTAGHRTQLEWATDFLRDHVWVGETITVLVRDTLYQDAHLASGELLPAPAKGQVAALAVAGLPLPARIAASEVGDLLAPVDLALALAEPQPRLRLGEWYATLDNPGVAVSVVRPGLVDGELLASPPLAGGRLDPVEAEALVYLVGFDLAHFEAGFAVGTDHPRVGWSERARADQRDDFLPGPDGIDSIAPLVAGGIVPFDLAERTVATFTAGFKRSHGAFASGLLGSQNSGSHYGFVESGVVLSKLQPGLATIFGLADGSLQMKTWSRADDALLEQVAFARQNGVAIVETPAAGGEGVAGSLVARWGDGNWSGSEDKRLRSLRAGLCLQESAAGRFLIYGYFSSATPIAMARVFQAYRCSYAMITDMNALEHTYLALYRVAGARLEVDHLIGDMALLDKTLDGQVLPRFLGFADNRDFFYLLRRASAPVAPDAQQDRP